MTHARPHRQIARWVIATGLALLLLCVVAAAAAAQVPDNSVCLGCHSQQGLTVQLANGEVLPLTVEPQMFSGSVHGQSNMACVSCHTNITGYPHPKITAGDRRSFQLERYTQCQSCHQEQYRETLDGNHARALAAGNREAAICTDCHGAHNIQKVNTVADDLSSSCQKCHSTIYNQFAGSVHASSLRGNEDAPACTDCHGSHMQEDPTTAAFRLKSPRICSGCHSNAALMSKYGITSGVFDTYVADFHGTTVKLFEQQSPDQPTNKAVCTDCHGIHNIMAVDRNDAQVVKENLLTTCQKCHPTADANFPNSWVGHFPPSSTNHPLVYYVNLFYSFFIPAVIGGMGLYVLLDAVRRIRTRFQRRGA